jgi:uncharacterized protein (DUF1015 family)
VADVRAFRALRPPRDLAARVVAPPYDVVGTEEARKLADGNPLSFLHVTRPEIGFAPGTDPHTEQVYRQGRTALDALVRDGVLRRDSTAGFSVYRQTWRGRAQTGVVGCVTVADYDAGVIRTHEHTRPDKETDRARHIAGLDAHDEPVFLLTPPDPRVAAEVAAVVTGEPDYDLTVDTVRHTLWVVDDPDRVSALREAFAAVTRLYVADGHHRSAAAGVVHRWRTEPGAGPGTGHGTGTVPGEGAGTEGEARTGTQAGSGSGSGGSGVFPAVIFPADELRVLAYNRVVTDLAGHRPEDLPGLLSAAGFEVTPAPAAVEPQRRHEFGAYLAGQWFRLVARDTGPVETDPIARLAVSLLQDRVLGPVLGVTDPRTDARIRFVGGIRGTAELEHLVDTGQAALALSLYPTSTEELLAVADTGQVMPPKSTWFEPKLLSGLFVHPMDPDPGS